MRFVVVRHGQSGNNLLWQQTGGDVGRSPDPTLTGLGEEQAAALAAYAESPGLPWTPTHLYCSPMWRAVQTAAPLADVLDLPLVPLRDLAEVGGPYDVTGPDRTPVPHPGSSRTALAGLSTRLTFPAWITEEGWWTAPVETTDAEPLARAERLVARLRTSHEADDVVALGDLVGKILTAGPAAFEFLRKHTVDILSCPVGRVTFEPGVVE